MLSSSLLLLCSIVEECALSVLLFRSGCFEDDDDGDGEISSAVIFVSCCCDTNDVFIAIEVFEIDDDEDDEQ